MNGDIRLGILILWPMAAALAGYLIGLYSKKWRCYFADAAVVLEMLLAVSLLFAMNNGTVELIIPEICGMGLHFMLDGFRVIYLMIAAFMWMMSTIFTREYIDHSHNTNRYYFFILFTLGATAGVFLSADLFTTFVFFEMMSLASYTWVAHEQTKPALRAADTYLAVAIIGGMVTLMGLFMLYSMLGTLEINELYTRAQEIWPEKQTQIYAAGGLTLFGFMAKAGAFPIHIWLPKAHPVAPAPSSALLSGILTKTGVFGVVVLSVEIFRHNGYWGFVILMIGVVTMMWGGIIAICSNDLKRTLACSSVSQIGFIFVGIGMQGLLGEENALAVRGTYLHMMNHSLIKLALFMAAGVVYMNLHHLELSKIRGFGRKKPFLNVVFLMGALGVGGVPLWNGYISKTLIHESIIEYIELIHEGHQPLTFAFASGHQGLILFQVIEWLFILTGGMTVAYMLKLYICLFIEKNADEALQMKMDNRTHYMQWDSVVALGGSAVVLPILGMLPNLTMDKIADMSQAMMHGVSPAHAVHYFSFANLKGGLCSILAGVLMYLLIVRTATMKVNTKGVKDYVNCWPKWLDLEDSFYRPIIFGLLVPIGTFAGRMADYLVDFIILFARKTTHRQLKMHKVPRQGFKIGFYVGLIADKLSMIFNRVILRKKPVNHSYVIRFSAFERLARESLDMITATIAYSLVMFGIGTIVIIIYIIL